MTTSIQAAGEVTISAMQAGDRKDEPYLINHSPLPLGGAICSPIHPTQTWFDATDVNGDGLPDTSDDFISSNRVSIWADKSGNRIIPYRLIFSRCPLGRLFL